MTETIVKRKSNLKDYQKEKYPFKQKCIRCGHKWNSETRTGPADSKCPKCRSPYWNKPRKNRSQSRSALKKNKTHGTLALKIEDYLGIKKDATENGYNEITGYMSALLKGKGIEQVTPEEYEVFKKQRKSDCLPVIE